MRGQGIKLTSYVAKKCREKNTLIPVIEKGSNSDDGYEGAIVLDPKTDIYLDNPVACVDYASLYPSSMISENLSHDSKVWTQEYDLKGNLLFETGEKDMKSGKFIYDNLPGYDYVNIQYDTFRYYRKTPKSKAEKIKCGYKICRFAQFPEGQRAIMPSILEELLLARKTTRKQIPLQTDDFMKNVLDKRQLGYKVTANSLYGQCGARTSTFYEKDIAACTTATGRLLLTYAKRVIEECYGDAVCQTINRGPVLTKAEYIYGDSVASYTPIYVRNRSTGIVDILAIEDLAAKYGNNNWIKCIEKGKQDKEFCELIHIETWTDKGWTQLYRVIRHLLAPYKKMVRVFTNTGYVVVTDDHSLVLKTGEEISPNSIINNECTYENFELLHNKLSELYSDNDTGVALYKDELLSDLHKTDVYKFEKNDWVNAAKLTNCLNFMKIPFEIVPNITTCISIHITKNIHKVKENVKWIEILDKHEYDGYVYDLTTENHHFAAGIGDLIVHNTDSVFFTFNLQTPEGKPIRGKEALEITIELAQEAGHLASSFLKGPHDLEYEKTFMPFCLLSKKRYVGMLYETDPNKGKRKEMGIVLKRRDNAPIVKDVYGGIIDIIMKEQNIVTAMEFLKTNLRNLINEKISMNKLIITKSLRSEYKNPKSIAHKVLSDRIAEREPGNKPKSGDRIPFVYIYPLEKKKTKMLQGDLIETPTFIVNHHLKIDYSYYITNQIMKPVQQLFGLVLERIWEIQGKQFQIRNFHKELNQLLAKLASENTSKEKTQKKIEDLRNKRIKELIFDPFLREIKNQKEGNRSIMGFF
jgi:DNA polymerase elongation subunit (family B)